MDVFPEHPGEDILVCFHTMTLAKECFYGPAMQKTLRTSGYPGPWQIERLSVKEWAKMAKDFCLKHNIKRVAFMH